LSAARNTQEEILHIEPAQPGSRRTRAGRRLVGFLFALAAEEYLATAIDSKVKVIIL
jgi:hypothetical protein